MTNSEFPIGNWVLEIHWSFGFGHWSLVLPRVRRRNNFAHAGLVKAFEAFVSLEVFQVRSERAVFAELLRLLVGDVPGFQGGGDSILVDRPAFAFGEGLAKEREIRERLHHSHAV